MERGDSVRTNATLHYVLAEIPKKPVFVDIHKAVVSWLPRRKLVMPVKNVRNPLAGCCWMWRRALSSFAKILISSATRAMCEFSRQFSGTALISYV